MDIKNKRLKGYFVLSVLIIACLVMASAMTFYMPNKNNENIVSAATLDVHTPSALFLNGSFSDILEGEQKEYIYFGNNVTSTTANAPGANNTHTGVIKWRVLSTDSGYSSGNLLLWADYQLGSMQYNIYANHANYAYYSTSLIRATLNGGTYYYGASGADPSSSTTITDSYLKIFSDNEIKSVATASSYSTKLVGFQTTSHPSYATTGIVGSGDGQYTTENVNTMNNRAGNCSASISQDGSSVIENTSGDYLFLLDYYDINNPDYGFGDNGKVYANVINSTWTPSSAGYPGFNDNSSLTSEYLKFSGDINENYWLRPASRYTSGSSSALLVYCSGCVSYFYVNSDFGVRPAFNLSPSSVIYATASANGRNNTFTAVNSYTDNKPAYKVYTKTDSYTAYSDVKITVKDDKLSVEKSGASGSAIILLADKSGSGKVEYQATANFNGSGVATATLPSGVNPRDYSITVLFTDGTARGENYSESIKGSYTVSGHNVVPQANSVTTKYKYISDGDVSFELANVYDKNIVDNSAWVDITIEGKNYKGETIAIKDSKWSIDANHKLTLNVSEAGDYTIKIKPKDGNSWADGTTAEKTYKYTLKYKLKAIAWDNNSASITKTYNGGDQYLELKNFDEDIAKLVTLSPTYIKIPDGQTNAGKLAIKVKDYAKEEKVAVSLNTTYKDYLVWDETNYPTASKELKYSVNKKELSATPLESDWKMEANAEKDEDRTFYLWIGGVCKEEDVEHISFTGYYKKGANGAEQSIATAPEFVKDESDEYETEDGKYKLKIVLPNNLDADDYTYVLKFTSTSSANYSLPMGDNKDKYEKTFKIENKSVDIKEIKWQYRNAKLDKGGWTKIDEFEGDTFNVTYNGNLFEFQIDTDFENKYKTDVKFAYSQDSEKSATNVKANDGYYTIKVTLTALKTGINIEKSEFTFKWKIEKAMFDLSEVEWDYTKPIEFDDKQHEVKLINLPKGLKAVYSGDFNNVRKANSYTATVTLQFDKTALADVDNNYIRPTKPSSASEEKTYIYEVKDEEGNAKEFPWSLDWVIKKKTFDLEEEWVGEVYTDKNDMPYFAYKIETASTEAKIDYEYYAYADYVDGKVVDGKSPIKREDIVVNLEGDPVKYWVVAKIKTAYANDYEIKEGTQAMEFKVGLVGTLIKIDMDKSFVYNGKSHGGASDWKFEEDVMGKEYISAKYYLIETIEEDGEEKEVRTLLDGAPTKAGKYIVKLSIDKEQEDSYMLSKGSISFEITQAELTIALEKDEFVYNAKDLELKLQISCDDKSLNVSGVKIKKTYYLGEEIKEDGSNRLADGVLPKNVGKYIVVLSIDETDEDNYRNYKIKDTCMQFNIEITPYQITAVWDTTGDIPALNGLSDGEKEIIEYVYTDSEGNVIEDISTVEAGNYKVIARIKSEHTGNYVFVDGDGQVLENANATEQSFEIEAKEPENPDNPTVPVDPENPDDPNQPPATGFDINKIGEYVKEYWQLIASIISIILMLIFISKTVGYENKRKQNKKTIDKKYSTFYGITLFGLATATWTMIACVLMGGALLTFIIMLVAKSKCKKSDEELEDAKDEFERNQKDFDNRRRVDENQHRDEQLQMMLMGMLGGNANGQNGGGQSFVYQQPGLGADDIRGIVADTMNNMLPNVTQYLPQEASHSDELIQQLIEQNAQNEERMRQMNEQNEQRMQMMMQQLAEQNNKNSVSEDTIERLVEKLSSQRLIESVAEKEVASANANDEVIKSLIEGQKAILEKLAQQDAEKKAEAEKAEKQENADIIKKLVEGQDMLMRKLSEKPAEGLPSSKVAEIDRNTDKIEMLVRNQERLMERVIEMSAKNSDKSNERLMEKMIELSVKADNRQTERIVEKPVEKIVEKEVRVEVPVEKIVEVEKVVPMPIEKPAKTTKAPAQRLMLDEAYEKLSATQKKIFDTLKNYAMSKDKCKEKKSTYFTVLGQSTVNPLVKLTIKKNTTVAMFKMEDEYFKDIRRNAGSDGTKMKVKETELIVGDNQALSTAKDMIDLREDQIERYNDFLKEQKSLRKK